jgi:hypothetical protein
MQSLWRNSATPVEHNAAPVAHNELKTNRQRSKVAIAFYPARWDKKSQK